MCIEIEAKLKVDSFEDIKVKLADLHALFIETQQQTDIYFDNENSSMVTTDTCLRLRLQQVADTIEILLTYKGPREKGRFKRRQELELKISDSDLMAKLLLALGYKKIITVEKKRQAWRLEDCIVALDLLPNLGSFIEIEGPNEEKIEALIKRLGLKDLPHITESYACLLAKKLQNQKL